MGSALFYIYLCASTPDHNHSVKFILSFEATDIITELFNQVCMELYTMPKPTVAAVTGHAIAGGCILALCCDYRFAAEGRKLMGLNEIRLGVPVPYLADCVLRQIVGARNAREIMETGEFYLPEQSLQIGMIDRVLPLEKVVADSIASFPVRRIANPSTPSGCSSEIGGWPLLGCPFIAFGAGPYLVVPS